MSDVASTISSFRSLASFVSCVSIAAKTVEREQRNELCTGKVLSWQIMVKSARLMPLLLNADMSLDRLSSAIDRMFSEIAGLVI